MFIKSYPVFSVRTGITSGTYTGTHVDPVDDQRRLCDFGPTVGNTSSIQNCPATTGTDLFPVRANTSRTIGIGQDFSHVAIFPRRLNNQAGSSASLATLNNTVLKSNLYTAATTDQNLDINTWANGYRHMCRVGYNLLLSYTHFGTGGDSDANSNDRNPFFLCKDGVVRRYAVQVATDLTNHLAANFPNTATDLNNRWQADDVKFYEFVGTPPSEDLVSSAAVPGMARLMASDVAPATAITNPMHGNALSGWLLDTQNRVVAGNSTESAAVDILNDYSVGWASEPLGPIQSDSGSIMSGMTNDGPWAFQIGSPNSHSVAIKNVRWWEIVNETILAYTGASSHVRPDGTVGLVKIMSPDTLEQLSPKATAITGPIKPKRSEVASSVPAAGDLAVGELAINSTDKAIYTKKADGTVVTILPAFSAVTQLLLASQTQAQQQGFLGLGVIGTRASLNHSYTGFIEAPQTGTDYVLDAGSAGAKTLTNIKHRCTTASGTFSVVKVSTANVETNMLAAASTGTTSATSGFTSTQLASNERLLIRFSGSSNQNFEFTVTGSVTA